MEFSSEQTHELRICIDNIRLLKYLHDENVDVKEFGMWTDREIYGGFSYNGDGSDLFFKGLSKLFDEITYDETTQKIRISWEAWDKLIELKGIDYINDHFKFFKEYECIIDGCTTEVEFFANNICAHFDWMPTFFSLFIAFFIQFKNEVNLCLNKKEAAHG